MQNLLNRLLQLQQADAKGKSMARRSTRSGGDGATAAVAASGYDDGGAFLKRRDQFGIRMKKKKRAMAGRGVAAEGPIREDEEIGSSELVGFLLLN